MTTSAFDRQAFMKISEKTLEANDCKLWFSKETQRRPFV